MSECNSIYINSPQENPYLDLKSIKYTELEKDDKLHIENTYRIKHDGCWQFTRGFIAFLITVMACVPLFIPLVYFSGRIIQLWKEAIFGTTTEKVILLLNPKPKFHSVDEKEIMSLQSKMQSTIPGIKEPLNLEKLRSDERLFPKHKITIDGVNFYCSNHVRFAKTQWRWVAIGLVEIKDKVFPRIFFLSNSQACWRVMSDFTKNANGAEDTIGFGAGHRITDLSLPLELNLAFLQLFRTNSFPPKELPNEILKMIVEQTTTKPASYLKVVNPPVSFIEGQTLNQISYKLPKEKGSHPDFSKSVIEETLRNVGLYGDLKAKVFLSNDKNLKYLFYEADDERVFLASVEIVKDNQITPYGVRYNSFDVGQMGTSLLVRGTPDTNGMYRHTYNKENAFHGSYRETCYQNAWNEIRNYKIIRHYYKAQSRPIPPPI
jgi:hypothetical protein